MPFTPEMPEQLDAVRSNSEKAIQNVDTMKPEDLDAILKEIGE